ncbi:hypothetical protein ACWEO4_39010 [Streptomyces sp. NPDC004393]|uniref:hypothetical protein n=1 Tax=Streptomyces sp. NPDC004533 TaxID=3154278 RepID=UPI0033B304FD
MLSPTGAGCRAARGSAAGVRGTLAAPDNGRFRVLVVEDDDVIGHHLQTGLQVRPAFAQAVPARAPVGGWSRRDPAQ